MLRLYSPATLFLTLTSLMLLWTSGCTPDPLEASTERVESLADLLEAHKAEPEVLLEKLEAFVAEEKANFAADREALEALDRESLEPLVSKHEKRLRRALERLFNVTLEIQDRLRTQPDKLIRFHRLLAQLRSPGDAP